MKTLLTSVAFFTCLSLIGCGEPVTTSVVDTSTKQSQVDEYNRMLMESQSTMQEGEDAQKAASAAMKK